MVESTLQRIRQQQYFNANIDEKVFGACCEKVKYENMHAFICDPKVTKIKYLPN